MLNADNAVHTAHNSMQKKREQKKDKGRKCEGNMLVHKTFSQRQRLFIFFRGRKVFFILLQCDTLRTKTKITLEFR